MPSPRAIILIALLLVMEVLAGFSLVVGTSLLDATSLQYGLFWLFLLAGLAGVAVALAITALRPRHPWDRAILLTAGTIAAIVPAWLVSRNWVSLVVAAILLAVAYWRGATSGQETPDHGAVQARFGIGFGILFTGLVWIVARGVINRPSLWHMLAIVGIAYTVVAMVALVLSRVERSRMPGATQAIVLAVGLQLGLLTIISLVAIEIFAHDLASALFTITRPLWDAIGPIWFDLLTLLFTPIQWILDLLRAHAHAAHHLNLAHPTAPHDNPPHKRLHATPVHSPFLLVAGIIFLLAIVSAIGALIWKAAARFSHRRHEEPGFDDERLNGLSLAAIWHSLRRWLRGLFHRGTKAAGGLAGATRRRIFGPVYPEDPVRRMYAQVLYRAAHLGVTRPAAVTPVEFQSFLARVWPDGAADFAAVTDAYVMRRYGEVSFGQDELETLRERWHRLRAMMRRQTAVVVPVTDTEGVERTAGRRRAILGSLAEAQTIRSLVMDITGSVLALIAVFGFVIAALVIAILLSSR